jgi:hypothetical protein
MEIKPFSQDLFNKFNEIVLNHIIVNLKFNNYFLEYNPDKYGIDLVILNLESKVCGYIEGEYHGKYWNGLNFPFKTAHFLGRKNKYNGNNSYYIMTNNDGKSAIMIPFNNLIKFKQIPINNIYMNKEMMYDVPLKECILGWDKIIKYIEKDLNKTCWNCPSLKDNYCKVLDCDPLDKDYPCIFWGKTVIKRKSVSLNDY